MRKRIIPPTDVDNVDDVDEAPIEQAKCRLRHISNKQANDRLASEPEEKGPRLIFESEQKSPTSNGFHSKENANLKNSTHINNDDTNYLPKECTQEISTEEDGLQIAFQVFLPFIAAGLGMVCAGLLLDKVQHWQVFRNIPELFILVPSLLGLKGNLEMTLCSRLSTAANVGHMDSSEDTRSLVFGNIVLTQAQALVVGTLASLAVVIFCVIPNFDFEVHYAFILCASAILTAALASLILGGVMIVVILLSKSVGINPDNVATPIAASLGDLVTLALLAFIGEFLFGCIGTHNWIAPCLIVLCLVSLPVWFYLSHCNKYVKSTLYNGWVPVISAMCISSLGGLVLSDAVTKFKHIALFSPIINGVGGNLVAVQASRLSTHLHLTSKLGELPQSVQYGSVTAFFTGGGHFKAARVLILMSIPGHLIFSSVVGHMSASHFSLTQMFVAAYVTAGLLQVTVLLFVCDWLVHVLWKLKKDPDNYSIPYLTALGDLLGTTLLAGAFQFLHLTGDSHSFMGME